MSIGLVLVAVVLAQTEAPAPAASAPGAVAAESDGAVIPYTAAFFADARPTSAFDMIQRLPGFTFDRGDTVRGFAGAAGNVLIDGERPTSKSVTLEDLLRSLPATSVIRIDLIRGGASGIDMQGLPLVANVIRSQEASQDLAVTGGIRSYSDDGWTGGQADLEWARRSGALSLEGAAHYSGTESPDGGHGQRTRYAPNGAVRETGPFYTREHTETLSANGSAELDLVDDLYRFNAGISRSDNRAYETVDRQAPTGGGRGEQVTGEGRIQDKAEFGDTHAFSAALSSQVLALQTLTWVDSTETSTQPGLVEVATSNEKSGESILRGSFTYQPSKTLSIEAGGEGAYNFLDGKTAVTESGVPVPLPNVNLRVTETRGEAFITASWRPSSQIAVTSPSVV